MSIMTDKERRITLWLAPLGLWVFYTMLSQGHYIVPLLLTLITVVWYAYEWRRRRRHP